MNIILLPTYYFMYIIYIYIYIYIYVTHTVPKIIKCLTQKCRSLKLLPHIANLSCSINMALKSILQILNFVTHIAVENSSLS
jgi:hypothetical protein